MPEWLLKKDDYIPQKEKDIFINKSILSILGMLTKIRLQTEAKGNKFGINAVVKVLLTLVTIILVSISRNSAFVIFVDVFLVLIVSLLNESEIKYLLKLDAIILIFTFVILLPSIIMGNKNNSYLIMLKVLATVTAVNLTACTTKWNDIITVLKVLFVPDLFIFVLDITIKYIVIFGEFSLNMLYSLKLRSVGKCKDKSASLTGIMGTLFLKSKEMSEEMYGAMECRGFAGEYKVYRRFKISIKDIPAIAAGCLLVVTYFYLDRL